MIIFGTFLLITAVVSVATTDAIETTTSAGTSTVEATTEGNSQKEALLLLLQLSGHFLIISLAW